MEVFINLLRVVSIKNGTDQSLRDEAKCLTLSIRLAKMKSFENLLKMFMDKIHLYNYIGNSEFAKDKTIKTEKYTRLAGYFLLLFLMADWIAWYVTPIWHLMQNIEEVRNQTIILQTAPRLWMPFDYKYNIRNWSLVHIINAYIGFSACGIFITFNILSFIFIFHLIGHVQILKYRFRTEFKNPMNNDATKETLISLIKYHNFIVEVFKDTQTAFGPNVTANYFHNLLCDSLLMYGIMLGDKKDIVIFGLMFLVFMGGLILMSLIMEEIRRESVDLADVIYSIPWEKMSISNQKNVTMILARAQPPLEFISAGGLRAGVRPAISIIKSTFSYYVMLKSAMNVEK
ncbi:odorant receptor 10-like [Battus philenor]|uniref:odorant receptor 10-like n=1 Tax=Battus philenor TaxID=42288 RepID=UPI0035CF8236